MTDKEAAERLKWLLPLIERIRAEEGDAPPDPLDHLRGMTEEELGQHLAEHNRRITGGDKPKHMGRPGKITWYKQTEWRVIATNDIFQSDPVYVHDGQARRASKSDEPNGMAYTDISKGEAATYDILDNGSGRLRSRRIIDPKPFYGVDGNLLIEDLAAYKHETVQQMLDGTWKSILPHGMMGVGKLLEDYPQLRDEMQKRRHRRAYRARLEAKRAR